MASSEIQDPLCNQERFEDGCNSSSSFNDNIQMLKLLISILKSCLGCMLKWHIRQENVLVRLKHIDNVVENVYRNFELLHANSAGQVSANEDWRSSATNQELVLSNLMKLKLIEPDMKEIYLIVAVAPTRKLDSVKSVFDSIFWPFKICLNCMKLSPVSSQIIDPSVVVSKASDVLRFLDSLLKILKEMVSNKADLIAAMEQQIAALEDRLRFFRNFLWLVVKQCKNEGELRDLLTYAEVVAVHVACLLYLCLVCDEMNGNVVEEMKIELVVLVEKIKPIKPEIREIHLEALNSLRSSEAHDTALIDEHYLGFVDFLLDNLRELSNNQVYCLLFEKEYIEILIDELHLLRFNLLDPPHPAVDVFTCEHQALMVHIKAGINKIANYFCLLYITDVNEDTTWQLNLVLFSVLEEIECIKKEATDLYDKFIPKSWRSNFPSTNELGFLEVFIKNLKEQLKCNQSSICPFGGQIEAVYEELETIRKNFREISVQRNESVELTVVLAHIKDVAYHAEYVVDSLVAKARSFWCHQLGLFEVTKEIKVIQKELKSIRKKIAADSPCLVSSQDSTPKGNEVLGSMDAVRKPKLEATKHLVAHKATENKILEQVTKGSKELNILSIVGMPGIGKTTLANSVYENHSVTLHFHIRAWCCVSQVYQKDILLLDILGQISGNTNQIPQIDTQDYVEKVWRSLKGRRYLIVLDDIWDIEAWNVLKDIFPEDQNGSRILFTSRDCNVALEAALKAKTVRHELFPLTDEQSWELLCIKVFEEKSCPPGLSQVGMQIAKNCKGLPFAVVSIAGVLKTTDNVQDLWEEVEESFRSKELNNPLEKYHVSILELCYQHLPNYLKPCFLYFGAFREDAVIPVSKLLWIWIAEGFIHQSNPIQNSLENEAENYLKILIDRSLVMVAERSSTGGVKSCCVHDLLRDFCLEKAEQENFLLHVKRHDGHSTNSSNSIAHHPYRLCTDSNSHAVSLGTFTVRSLLFSFWLYQELHLVNLVLKFRLLRVLDLSNVRIYEGIGAEDFVKITELVHLRFLAIPLCRPEVPFQIMNLQNLETLIIIMIKRSGNITLPMTFWNLGKLRHLHVKIGIF